MDSEDVAVAAPPDESKPSKNKNYKEKIYDLKYLKKRLPIYINLTKTSDANDMRKGLIGIKTILLSKTESEDVINVLHHCGGIKHLVKLTSTCTDQRQLGVILCLLNISWNRITQNTFRVDVSTFNHLRTTSTHSDLLVDIVILIRFSVPVNYFIVFIQCINNNKVTLMLHSNNLKLVFIQIFRN